MRTKLLQMTIRIVGLIQLVLGIIFWTGNARPLVMVHIFLGLVLTIALFVLTVRSYRAGVARWLVLLAAIWALGLPIWGMAQESILAGPNNWISQVLHVLCGVGAIGIAEILAVRPRLKSA
ncbi:MAG: hypothetical protein AB9891_13545 [Anaerolineaceae bacterium]